MLLKMETRNSKRAKNKSTKSGLHSKVKMPINEPINLKPLDQIIRKTMIRKSKKDKRANRMLKRKIRMKELHRLMVMRLKTLHQTNSIWTPRDICGGSVKSEYVSTNELNSNKWGIIIKLKVMRLYVNLPA